MGFVGQKDHAEAEKAYPSKEHLNIAEEKTGKMEKKNWETVMEKAKTQL